MFSKNTTHFLSPHLAKDTVSNLSEVKNQFFFNTEDIIVLIIYYYRLTKSVMMEAILSLFVKVG